MMQYLRAGACMHVFQAQVTYMHGSLVSTCLLTFSFWYAVTAMNAVSWKQNTLDGDSPITLALSSTMHTRGRYLCMELRMICQGGRRNEPQATSIWLNMLTGVTVGFNIVAIEYISHCNTRAHTHAHYTDLIFALIVSVVGQFHELEGDRLLHPVASQAG